MTITEAAQGLAPHLSKLRRDFHRFPEVSGNESQTAEGIVSELTAIGGYRILKNVGGHGVLAELQGALPGKTVALRADMDALQIHEETGLPFCSQNSGVMHACGHDNHMAMLLGAARLLADRKDELPGTVRVIFQPAEELSPKGGSRDMIAAGALDGVDAVFGLHVWPELPIGTFGTKPGPLMAASDHFSVQISGKSSHAAAPEEGIDAVTAAAQFISAIQTIVSRNTDPVKPAVISVGKVNAGTRYNIIAETCEMEGTCRTFDPEIRNLVARRLQEILDGVCRMSGCTGQLKYDCGYMSVNNNPAMADYLRDTAADLFGRDHAVLVEHPSMCGEDFAFYLAEKPGAFAWLGTALPQKDTWPLHSSRFDVDESVLWRGSALLAQLALQFR